MKRWNKQENIKQNEKYCKTLMNCTFRRKLFQLWTLPPYFLCKFNKNWFNALKKCFKALKLVLCLSLTIFEKNSSFLGGCVTDLDHSWSKPPETNYSLNKSTQSKRLWIAEPPPRSAHLITQSKHSILSCRIFLWNWTHCLRQPKTASSFDPRYSYFLIFHISEDQKFGIFWHEKHDFLCINRLLRLAIFNAHHLRGSWCENSATFCFVIPQKISTSRTRLR